MSLHSTDQFTILCRGVQIMLISLYGATEPIETEFLMHDQWDVIPNLQLPAQLQSVTIL